MRQPIIVVSGPIAAGKSTTTRGLAAELGLPAHVERHDRNPFLQRFYSNPGRWAVLSQLFFFFEVWIREQRARMLGGIVEGSVIDVHLAFNLTLRSDGVVGDVGAAVLGAVFNALRFRAIEPDLVLLLQAPASILRERILTRGRREEFGVSEAYLEALAAGPRTYWRQRMGPRCITVDTTRLDVRDPVGLRAIVREYRNGRIPSRDTMRSV